MVTSRMRSAFTLVELLMVVTLIAILVGMLLAAVGPIRESLKQARTQTIVGDIGIALNAVATEGHLISPVEHPLAGSAPTRSTFIRADTGVPVDATSQALVTDDLSSVAASDQGRVLLPTDLYQGGGSPASCQLPLIYGVARARLCLLSATDNTITKYLRLPKKTSRWFDKGTGYLQSPYNNTVYPDREFLFDPQLPSGKTIESESQQTLEQDLSLQRAEILNKGGIFTADSANGSLIVGGRLWYPNSGTKNSLSAWQPGYVNDGGTWKRYRPRGTGLYDSWGNEILCSILTNGGYRVESAGRDGVFRWNPGSDGVFQTAPRDTAPSGDDRDGSRDNVNAVTKE